MTPQELMDLPYAGMAEKELRLRGMWNVTATDTERLEWIAENVKHMVRHPDPIVQSWHFDVAIGYYDIDFLRDDIDDAASKMGKDK